MPRRLKRLLGDRVKDRLGRRTLRPGVDETGEQDTGVKEDAHGHRLRSSSTSAAISTDGRASTAAVGLATSRLPTLTSRGRGATRSSRTPKSSTVISRTVPGGKTRTIPDAGGDHHAACLVDGRSHGISLPANGKPEPRGACHIARRQEGGGIHRLFVSSTSRMPKKSRTFPENRNPWRS